MIWAAGCGLTDAHRAADRGFYEAVAPDIHQYWANDSTLDKDQVERRERFLRTWKLFVDTGDPQAQPVGDEELVAPKANSGILIGAPVTSQTGSGGNVMLIPGIPVR